MAWYNRAGTLAAAVALAVAVACTSAPAGGAGSATGQAPSPMPVGVQAISFLGDTLRTLPLSPETRARYERQLAEARAAYDRAPANADSIVWYGRRLAYLGRLRDAIDVYTRGIALHPENPWLYRHRGHRYISVRDLDRAIGDLEKAAALVEGKPDVVEPDGQPNAQNTPIGTLHSNIAYHLALAYYLKGDYARAIPVYRRELADARNDDRRVSTAHWLYMSLRRLGRDTEAAEVLVPMRRDMSVIENQTYHDLMLMYKGELPADSVLKAGPSGEMSVTDATAAYGVGNWHLYNGRRADAERIFRRILAGGQWGAFGYIAAEAELARMRSLPSSSSGPSSAAGAARSANGTEILWDSYGVPHIYAADRRGLAYAFGWAQMRNHADLMLRLVAQARGRAAEYLGPDYLEDDRWVWTLEMPLHARRMLDMQPADMRAHVEAFVDGINAFARANPQLVSDSVRGVLPVTATDIFSHVERVQYARFLSGRERVRDNTRVWAERGSNAWAIAPKRSASGKTMLLANPHLPWGDLFTWIEAQYVAPGVNVYGGALVLSPVLQIAFNDNLGWTHTVNTQDGEDLYDLTLSGDGYLLDGAVRPFERAEHVIRVRRPDGSFSHDTVRVRRSVHGPVVAAKPGKAIALAVVGLHGPELPGAFAQWWDMGRARNFDEFLAAIRPNQVSGQNITYGDRDGHTMMFYGGNTPVRPRGDRGYWAGIVRGDSSATLWTRLHSFDEMPRTVDPPSGWVQNANEPPWWASFPPQVRPEQYPPYLAPRPLGLRPQRSIRLLDEDSSITFAELEAYKSSTRMELADRVLDDLLPAAKGSPNEDVRRAAGLLEGWDRTTDAASRGGVLFAEWWREYGRRRRGQRAYATLWSAAAPRATPPGLADTAVAVAALEAAASTVARKYGAADVAWGDVYRVRRDGIDLPASGAGGEYGVFRVVGYSEAVDGKFEVAGGMSFVAAVEFASPVRARTIVGYGNASRTGSPHRTDQLQLFADKKLKPAWLTRREVEAHLALRERF